MSTATVRITTSTHDQLRELADQTGKTMQALVGEAVATYRRLIPGQGTGVQASKAGKAAPHTAMEDELSGDPNALACRSLGKAFLEENEGKYAAFRDGVLVATAIDKAALFGRLQKEQPDQSCLVVKVASAETF